MRRIRVVVAAIAAFVMLLPATADAATSQKPPYLFGIAAKACLVQSGARCLGSITAEAPTGALKEDLQVAASLAPSRGIGFGITIVAGGIYLDKARRSLPISVTFKVNSASASTALPASAAATGSYAAVIIGVGAGLQYCEHCLGFATKTIVSAGLPPATPQVPPAMPAIPGIPKLPPIPPPTPSVNLPGTIGPTTYTVKFNLTNGRSLVPAGFIGIGAYTLVYNFLGGRAAPTPDYLGKPQLMNDLGASHTKSDIVVTNISAG